VDLRASSPLVGPLWGRIKEGGRAAADPREAARKANLRDPRDPPPLPAPTRRAGAQTSGRFYQSAGRSDLLRGQFEEPPCKTPEFVQLLSADVASLILGEAVQKHRPIAATGKRSLSGSRRSFPGRRAPSAA
jgi:hypothetical protein